jgi:hypothetical protein
MGHVKDLIELIVGSIPANRGAVFGGLLRLGDRRVCALLARLPDGLA